MDHGYTEKQMEELAAMMPAVMMVLRRLANTDPDAKCLFEELDRWCWHVPECEVGAPCRHWAAPWNAP